jgi:c-di-GMP-binding flagellar brake protein YcgR
MEKGTLAIEKRKFPRVSLDATVRFRKLSSQKEKEAVMAEFVEVRSKDLSQGGLALVEMAALTSGDLLKVEVDVPGRDEPIKAYSEVMWIKPSGKDEKAESEVAGIKFMGLKPDDEEYLSNMIKEAVADGKELDGEASRLSEKDFIKKMGKRFTKED